MFKIHIFLTISYLKKQRCFIALYMIAKKSRKQKSYSQAGCQVWKTLTNLGQGRQTVRLYETQICQLVTWGQSSGSGGRPSPSPPSSTSQPPPTSPTSSRSPLWSPSPHSLSQVIHLTWSPGVKSKQTLADDNRSVSVITRLCS